MINRIVIFTGAISSGGAEKQSMLLAKAFKELGFEIIIISYFGKKRLKRYIDFLKDEKIECIFLEGSFLLKVKKINNLLKIKKPDTIFNYLPSNNILGGFLGKLNGVKLIVGNVRNSRLDFKRYLALLFSHIFFNKITIFNNQSGLKYFSKYGFNVKPTLYIPNCVYPIPQIKTYDNSADSTIRVLMVSRFEIQKDYTTALKSFKLLMERNKNCSIKIIIIGTGSLEGSIRKQIFDYNLDTIVEIHVNPENIFDYYRIADIFVQTSIFEGISNSILEAMSYCLPVVATDVGDNYNLIDHNRNGYITKKGDFKEIANKIQMLIRNKELRKAMGNESYIKVINDFSMDKFKKNYMYLIEKHNG